jgi:beta-xylosidase
MSIARTLLVGLLGMASASAAAEPLFEPVYRVNFPDPFILEHQGEFIAYSTNDGENLPMATSRNLIDWQAVPDPARPGRRLDGLPALAPWVKGGFTWAPEVMAVNGKWLLYYTANHRKKDVQCIGVAVANGPKGPFRDSSAEPMVCQFDQGGTIDANPFRDKDGKLYLYFKSDGNRVGKNTIIWGQAMAADGMAVTGRPVELLRDDAKWEMRVVEAPSMVRVPEGYAMFYSAGYYGWNAEDRLSPYSMGYAICTGALGPCKDAPANPLLRSYRDKDLGCLSGPGHQTIFRAQGGTFIGFHAWANDKSCRKAADKRFLYVAPFGWDKGKPEIAPGLRSPGGKTN